MLKSMLSRGNIWLVAARDSFIALLPLTYLGVFAVVLKTFPWISNEGLTEASSFKYIDYIIQASHGVYGLALAATVAIFVSRRLPQTKQGNSFMTNFSAGISAVVALAAVDAIESGLRTFDYSVILRSISIGIMTAETMHYFLNSDWVIRLSRLSNPESVYYTTTKYSLPIILTCLFPIVVGDMILSLSAYLNEIVASMALLIQEQNFNNLLLGIIFSTINQVFWFFGLHGGKLIDQIASGFYYYGPLQDSNLVWRPMFDSFVLLGGSGSTLGLLLAIEINKLKGRATSGMNYTRIALLPSLFNINEPVLFGLPVVLNPLYLFPFIVAPAVLWAMASSCLQLGWIEFQSAGVPWTAPPLFSGWMLTGSWKGVALQLAGIIVSTLIYLPFVKRDDSTRVREQDKRMSSAITAICEPDLSPSGVTQRDDEIGNIARGLLEDLRTSLDNRHGLDLFYQPKHDGDGKLVGAEALLRWKHPRHGILPPPVPVTLAEESGDIHMLGLYILEQACACRARWDSLGLSGSFVLAVNVSPLQLTDADFYGKAMAILRKYKVSARGIELEITESMALSTEPAVTRTVEKLSQSGIKISMDDFGMGFSSILYLQRFALHAIKLDGTLTRDVITNCVCADIISAVAALKKTNNIHIVAEYVENIEQRNLLHSLGCDQFQGYYYSPALNEADFWKYAVQYFSEQSGTE